MSRNRSNFVRVMGTASAVVLSSALAVPAVAIAADADGAVIVEQSYDEASRQALDVIEAIKKIETPATKNEQAYKDAVKAYGDWYDRFDGEWDLPGAEYTQAEYEALITNYSVLEAATEEMTEAYLQAEAVNAMINGDEEVGLLDLDEKNIKKDNFAEYASQAYDAQKALNEFDANVHPNFRGTVTDATRTKLEKALAKISKLEDRVDEYVESTIAGAQAIVEKVDKEAVAAADPAVSEDKATLDTAKRWMQDAQKLIDEDLARISEKGKNFKQYVEEIEEAEAALTAGKRAVKRANRTVTEIEARIKQAEADPDTTEEQFVNLLAVLQRANEALADANEIYDEAVAKKDSLTDNQKKIVELKDEITEINEAIENSPVENAARAIELATRYNAFPGRLPNSVRVDYAKKLVAALSDAQRDQLDKTYPLYLDKLKAAQDALDKKAEDDARKEKHDADSQAAQQVVDLIDAFPELAKLQASDKPAIDKANDAFNNLTDDQKALISDADLQKLADYKALVDRLAPAPVVSTKVFRLYNPNSGEHFYTADAEEKDALVTMGWTNETSEDNAWTSADETGTPVYRLYNPNAQGGDHHFTTSTDEVEALVKAGWVKDNGGKPVFYGADESGVAIYRAYNGNENAHNHNYTPDKAEQDALVDAGWADEGIAFYGAPLLKDAE